MGAYKYLEEIWKKKQSDLMRLSIWVHTNILKKFGKKSKVT